MRQEGAQFRRIHRRKRGSIDLRTAMRSEERHQPLGSGGIGAHRVGRPPPIAGKVPGEIKGKRDAHGTYRERLTWNAFYPI